RPHAAGAPGAEPVVCQVAVHLRDIHAGSSHLCGNIRRRLVYEYPNLDNRESIAQFRGAFGSDVARALRIEIKSQGSGSRVDGRQRVFAIRDAADLDDHAISALSAVAGSPDFIRCSPTRNAW